jgi:hypothetical protein
MNKQLSIIIILCLVLNGIGAAAFQSSINDESKIINQKINISINDLIIKETKEKYLHISFTENDQYILNPGKPILPKFTKIFEIPFGATNINVQVESSEKIQQIINKQIQPSPAPIPLSPIENLNNFPIKDQRLYQSNEPYPSKCYQYNVGVGINEHFDHVTYVTVHWYPIQYIPAQNIIVIADFAEVTITYT